MDVVAERDHERFLKLIEELDGALASLELQPCASEVAASSQSAAPGAGPAIAYEKFVDVAVALMHSDYASLQMLYPERGTGGELLLLAFRGFNPEAAKFWKWVRADSKSTCGIALRDTRRVIASDIANCDFMADSDDQQIYLQTGILACQTTPLVSHEGNVVGMISTHWRKPHEPSEKDLRLFDILARQAAGLIEQSRRQEMLQLSEAGLPQAFSESQ